MNRLTISILLFAAIATGCNKVSTPEAKGVEPPPRLPVTSEKPKYLLF